MSVNIKNERAHKLIRELAELTGETMTTAVITAVSERIERVRSEPPDDFVERMLAIGRDCAAHLSAEVRYVDHADLLYDDLGLPK